MMRIPRLSLLFLVHLLTGWPFPPQTGEPPRTILQRFADQWHGAEVLLPERNFVLAFWIKGNGGGEFSMTLSSKSGGAIADGIPSRYDLGFELDLEVLRQIDQGKLNALTAMGQAQSTDTTPMVPRMGEEFAKNPQADLFFRRISFFFWTRGWPKTI